ncbi:hypothetical protein [Roseospira navarrensis]|uniref:Uncharacterized protein n=1 Tax=Roseospira navarrensis TaxID=140058 RepID=A0A7X1ZFT1_9PROT|nr:hypothetical protein [Roseospira navarrensis]MQX37739.1 hypothetical protein [Roseospira navarrensis]
MIARPPAPPPPPPPVRTPVLPVTVLPQQRLLLQLVAMSGDIGITGVAPSSILWRTLVECVERNWVESREISPGVHKVTLKPEGRRIARAPETGAPRVG